MPIIDIVPGAGSSNNTIDFTLHKTGTTLTWDQLRNTDYVYLYEDYTNTSIHAKIVATTTNNTWYELRRSYMSFDLTNIYDVHITSAKLRLYGSINSQGLGDCGLVFAEWYMSNGANDYSSNNWRDIDFNNYLNVTNQTGFTTSSWNEFDIPTSFIQNRLGKYIGISMLLGKDYINESPSWRSNEDSEIDGNSTDSSSNKLTLRIEYTSSSNSNSNISSTSKPGSIYKGILIKDRINLNNGSYTTHDTLLVVGTLNSKPSIDGNKLSINFTYKLFHNSDMNSLPLVYTFDFKKSFECNYNSNIIDECYLYISDNLSTVKHILLEKDYPILNDSILYFDPKKSYRWGKSLISHKYWGTGTGSCINFYRNGDISENSRVYYDGPFGNTICWKAIPDSTSGADGGWGTNHFNIDKTRLYRYSVWVNRKVTGSSGTFYLGTHNYNSSNSSINIYSRLSGGGTTNPYFWYSSNPPTSSQLPEDKWILIVGHIWPYDSGNGSNHINSGRYYTNGTKLGNITQDFVWSSSAVTSDHRTYLYYCTDTTVRQYWAYPRVDLIDGTEPSIAELCSGNTETYFDLSSNKNNAFIVNGLDYINNNGGTLKLSYDSTPNIMKTNIGGNTNLYKNKYTFCAWVKYNTGSKMWLYSHIGSPAFYFGLSCVNRNNLGIENSWDSGIVDSINLNKWFHQTVVIDGNEARSYSNGVFLYKKKYSKNFKSDDNFVLYGGISSNVPAYYLYGYVGTYVIYNRVLSDDEIMYNFNIQKYRYGLDNNDVIQSGLTLYLDAANSNSYTTGTTIWYDLTSNNYDAYGAPNTSGSSYLNANFPTYKDIYGGVFEFDGTKQALTILSNMGSHTEITMDFWCYRDSNSTYQYLFDARNNGGSWWLTNHNYNINIGDALRLNYPSSTYTTNSTWWYKWINIIITSNSSGSALWINNEKITDNRLKQSNSLDEDLGQYFRIGARFNSNSGHWKGYFSNIRIYNRVLTDNEINWNYNLLKNRFIDPVHISDDIVLYLSASGQTGTTWKDLTGNGYDFTVNSNAHKTIKNVDFMDFSGDYGGAHRSSNVSNYSNVTFIFVATTINDTSSYRTLVRSNLPSNNEHQIIIKSGDVNLGMWDDSFIDSGFNIDQIHDYSSSWNFYVWKLSTSSPYYSFQYNDNKENFGEITNSNASFDVGFGFIGYNGGSNTQYWGKIAEVFYYKKHLSDDEIHYMYNTLNRKYKFGKHF